MREVKVCQAARQHFLLSCCCETCTNDPCKWRRLGLLIVPSSTSGGLDSGCSDAKVPPMKTCDKCHGAMLPERAVDLDAGLAITVFACLNCGRRKSADQEPRPITARH
jgi:hypothetical protein